MKRFYSSSCLGIIGAVCALLLSASQLRAVTVDGTRDGAYGAALAVQTVETGFGNQDGVNQGSELDAGYATIDSGRLYLMLTGNIEANFNKLEIFIDSKAGGQSTFTSAGNDGAGVMDGLKFDLPFTADYHLIVRRGSGTTFDVDFARLVIPASSSYFNVFSGAMVGAASTGTGVNASPIEVGYDNSNLLGVTGGTAAANQVAAALVTTGLELSFDLADLGYIGGPIHVMAGVNGSGHNYWANQFLGGLTPPSGNLGGDGAGNFTGTAGIDMTAAYAGGDQFFTIPEPTTITLVGVGLVGLLAIRRRKA